MKAWRLRRHASCNRLSLESNDAKISATLVAILLSCPLLFTAVYAQTAEKPDLSKQPTLVDEGRWFPAGSSMEEGDVNAPSAQGIIRQILYGNDWFRKELGKASAEYTGRNDKPDSRPKAPSNPAYCGKSRPWRSRFRNDDGFCRPFLHYAENGGLQVA